MNERIRELAERAGYQADMFGIGHWDQSECQKFAELIIRECATAITDHALAKDCDTFLMDSWAKGMRYSAHVLYEHFGVKP